MSWFLVDDELHSHEKVLALLEQPDGLAAIGLWTLCGSWSRKYRKAGFVPHTVVGALSRHTCRARPVDISGQIWTASDASGLPRTLVDAGLWISVDGGYQFHDWDAIYQFETKESERKRKDRDRKRAERALKKLQDGVCITSGLSNGRPADTGEEIGTEDSEYSSLEGITTCVGARRPHTLAKAVSR